MGIKPLEALQPRPATRARQSQTRDMQLHRIAKHRQIPNTPHRPIMDGRHDLGATHATMLRLPERLQLDDQPTPLPARLMAPLADAVSLPATKPGHTILFGHGRPSVCCLENSKSDRSAVRLSLSWEKNHKKARFDRSLCGPAPSPTSGRGPIVKDS